MIIDQLCVFSDNVAVKTTANSKSLAVSPLTGKSEEANVTVIVTEAYAAAATLAVAVQESADDAAYATLATYTFPNINKAGSVLAFDLPRNLKKKYVRLAYTVTGTTTTGKLFAAVTRDRCAPYEAGQYANAGKVVA